MTKRSRRPSRRRPSKIDQRGTRLDRVKLFLKRLLLARAMWRLLEVLFGDDPRDPPRHRRSVP